MVYVDEAWSLVAWEREYGRVLEQLPDSVAISKRVDYEGTELGYSDENPDVIRLIRENTFPILFDYQRELVAQVGDVVATRSAALLSLPTGGGKTRTGITAVLEGMAKGQCRRVVWLAPTVELLQQAMGQFEVLWHDFGSAPDIVLTRQRVRDAKYLVWLTTPQTVKSMISSSRSLGLWDVVVFDEAHQLGAPTFKSAVEALRDSGGNAAVVGMSATPGRVTAGETVELVEFFNRRLLRSAKLGPNPIATLQKRGVLAQLRFRRFSAQQVGKSRESERIVIASRAAKELVRRGRHVLVFAASVAGAYLLQDVLLGAGVSAMAIDSGLSQSKRLAAIASFGRRDVTVLINQRVLATGYDCPAVTDVFLLTEIGSPILFEQIVGRGARGPLTGGASIATIWEFDDHLKLHGLPSSYYRYRDYSWC